MMIGYLDLVSGLSGDMLLGCLVDAGWSIDQVRQTIHRLKLSGDEWSADARTVMKGPLRATFVDVRTREGHVHRHLADIRRIITAADLSAGVKERSIAVFTRLANAEARVHGESPDTVHFHEVGAMDAIIDIVGSIAGLDALGITKVYASPVPLGGGWGKMAHGVMPLPAPATLELLAAAGAPTCPAPGPGELVTPTGAALLAEVAAFEQPPMTLSRIAVGAGLKDFAWPNVTRLWLGEPQAGGPMVQLDTNIDDMNPQLYTAVSDRLFAAGAKDVWFTPVQMKKGRPAIMLSALGSSTIEAQLADVILRETTTLGVRVHRLDHRHEVRRELRSVETEYGPVRIKIKWLGAEAIGAMPEFEDCRASAEAREIPVRMVHDAAAVAGHALLHALSAADPPRSRATGG